MLRCTTARHTICHGSLCTEHLLRLEKLSIHRLLQSGPHVEEKPVCCLPLDVVQVPRNPQSSNSVQFAIVNQAVVSATGHCHPGHEVPVVQQRHVAPHIGHHHARLGTTCNVN